MASIAIDFFSKSSALASCSLACASIVLGASLGRADSVPLFDTSDDGGFVASSTGVTEFSFSDTVGWSVSNDSEISVIASIDSPTIVATAPSLTLEVTHSYSFEYSLNDSLPDEEGDAYDGGNLQVSKNGGAFTVMTNWIAGGYTPDFDGVDALGNEPGWSHIENDLTSTGVIDGLSAGDTLEFRFSAGWDDTNFATTPSWTISEFSVATVPEPATALMLGWAGLILAFRRRR